MDFILRYPNVEYEFLGILFNLIILFFSWNQSLRYEKTTIAFKVTAITSTLLILSETSLPYVLELGPSFTLLKQIIDSLQFAFSLATMFNFSRYMQYYTLIEPPKAVSIIINGLFVISFLLIISNPWTELIDSYDPKFNDFFNNKFYIIIGYLPAMIITVYACAIYLISFKKLVLREKLALGFTFLMSITGAFLQPILHGQLKIIGLFSSFGLFILYLSLETRDYVALNEIKIQLQDANDAARKANHAKSTFLANMSHEIRTPMNAMLGINEIILKTSTEDNILSYAKDMKIAGNILLHIINDVLDISKIEAGKLEIMEIEYHFTDLIDELKFNYEAKAKEKNLNFIFDIDEDLPDLLLGDEAHLRQILGNILSNAVKFTKTGEVRFSAFGINTDDKVKFTFIISDTGIGIKEEDIPNLFETFKRVDMENNRNIEGTGLGLSIAKQLVENMGGEIQVHSSYGDGSVFTVKISQKIAEDLTIREYHALQNKSKLEKQEDLKNVTPDLTGKELLVVDDNEMNIKVARAFLEPTGANITTFIDSIDAFRSIQQNKYDMIFLDDLMPKLSGSGLLKRMRNINTCPNVRTPVIIMTANTSPEDRLNYEKLGFNGFLAKPLQTEAVNELLNKF